MEDNDPSGYKSKKGIAAKESNKIDVLEMPKRSPDLMPLDYGFWAEVNKRMRKREQSFGRNFRETRAAYLTRLRRTATSMPKSFLEPLVKSLKRRVVALHEARGAEKGH